MATAAVSRLATTAPRAITRATGESRLVRWTLTAIALAFLALTLALPLVLVFVEALSKGLPAYWDAIKEPDALSAAKLTLLIAAIAVPINLVFGVAAAWCIAKFEFPGQAPPDHPDRPAVRRLAGDLGHDLRPPVRRARLARSVARRARHQDHLRGARHRARHHVRDVAVRGARADPAHAGAGHRGGRGRTRAGRERLADLLAGDAAQHQVGPAVRASSCATPARWASSARCRSSRATSAGETNTLPLHVEILYNEYDVRRELRGGVAAEPARAGHAGAQDRWSNGSSAGRPSRSTPPTTPPERIAP